MENTQEIKEDWLTKEIIKKLKENAEKPFRTTNSYRANKAMPQIKAAFPEAKMIESKYGILIYANEKQKENTRRFFESKKQGLLKEIQELEQLIEKI